ncbi:MAG: (Fe-S)-binding protein, partial [bacterium]|nr:(Fe-S)-binding protein [bacterium]
VCMQCGTCTSVCPWNTVKSFSPRALLKYLSLGLDGVEDELLWNCVTCNTCVQRCPRGVDLVDVMKASRAVMVEMGSLPPSFSGPLGSLRSDGNPWLEHRRERVSWQDGLGIPEFCAETEWLLFTCCTQAYDARNRKVAKALVELLSRAGLSFGSLKEKESCCGDQGSKMGGAEVYDQLAEQNAALFKEHGVSRMIVASPHCFNAFTREYGDLSESIEIVHHAPLLLRLVQEGRLVPAREVKKRVTYHDPCYLGRHNDIYDEPRALLAAIPGLDLLEMPRNREHALCCGGGGGGVWREVPIDERFAVSRIEEARETGAEYIVTACPYCTIMFEDAVKVLNLEEEFFVCDIAELLAESIREGEGQ